jgi:hypothetical protein
MTKKRKTTIIADMTDEEIDDLTYGDIADMTKEERVAAFNRTVALFEKKGEVVRTGEFRNGKPVYVLAKYAKPRGRA